MNRHFKNNDRWPCRPALTLLELLVVVTLIGIFSSVAAARFGRTLFGDFGSQSDARRVSLDLLQAQRLAILTGDNHYLDFTIANGKAVGYQIFRRSASGNTAADSYRPFTQEVAVTASHPQAEFTFEGQALAAYQVSLQGQNRNWQVTVTPINGAVRVVEL